MPRLIFLHLIAAIGLSFIGRIGHSQTDQNLIYATYLGGIGSDSGRHIEVMSDGSFLVVGMSESVNMPVTDDAWQGVWGGQWDNYIARFDGDGQLTHGGFLGGVQFDTPYGLAIKNNGGFVIVGSTSSDDFPVTPGAYNEQFIESMGYISSFDDDHQLVWSTFLGGAGQDIVLDVVTDANSNVYVTGRTITPGLATPGVFQDAFPEGFAGSFIAKFDQEGQLVWFSYGLDGAIGESIAISIDENQVYIAGRTGNEDLTVLNAYQSNFGGESDAFIAAFNTENGTLTWSTYYGGAGIDDIQDLEVAEDGTLFIAGETASADNMSTPDVYQEMNGGFFDHFLTAFSPDGNRIWSTYFGGELSESWIVNISLTSSDILMTGHTRSQENIAFGNPFESENSVSVDDIFNRGAYIARFDQETGNLKWSTYFMANCTQGLPINIAAIDDFKFAVIGSMGSTCGGFVTSDAYQPNNGGLNDYGFFIFEDATITSTKNPEILPLTVYPNPTRDAVRVEIPGQLFAPMALQVYDLTGRIVLEQGAYQSGNMLNVSALSPGLYVVKGRQGEQGFSSKLVLQ